MKDLDASAAETFFQISLFPDLDTPIVEIQKSRNF